MNARSGNTATATAMTAPLTVSSGYRRAAFVMMTVGGLGVAAGLWLAPQRTWSNLLLNNFYLLSIGLAGGVLLCFHFLSGAGWSASLRRVPEAMMAGLPVMAALVITLFFGRHSLYAWSRPEAVSPPLPPDKAFYLSTPFVLVRMLVVLGLWVWLASRIRRTSLAQDDDASLDRHRSLVRHAAAFAVVFALSFSLAGVDWLMSLDPHWFSTIFAVYTFAGVVEIGLAVTTLIVLLLRDRGPLRGIVTESHLRDLGTPHEPHAGPDSNVLALVLHPKLLRLERLPPEANQAKRCPKPEVSLRVLLHRVDHSRRKAVADAIHPRVPH